MKLWFASLVRVVIRPRSAMREILDRGSSATVFPLLLLAMSSGFFSDFDAPALRRAMAGQPLRVTLILCAVLVCVTAITILLFFFFSWVAFHIGRLMGGEGNLRDVRLALGWGLAPFAWSLLYVVPLALVLGVPGQASGGLQQVGDRIVRFNPGALSQGCGVALLFGVLKLLIAAWYLFVASNTLAEAHRFSAWKGLGTIAACMVVPFVIVLAGVLASL